MPQVYVEANPSWAQGLQSASDTLGTASKLQQEQDQTRAEIERAKATTDYVKAQTSAALAEASAKARDRMREDVERAEAAALTKELGAALEERNVTRSREHAQSQQGAAYFDYKDPSGEEDVNRYGASLAKRVAGTSIQDPQRLNSLFALAKQEADSERAQMRAGELARKIDGNINTGTFAPPEGSLDQTGSFQAAGETAAQLMQQLGMAKTLEDVQRLQAQYDQLVDGVVKERAVVKTRMEQGAQLEAMLMQPKTAGVSLEEAANARASAAIESYNAGRVPFHEAQRAVLEAIYPSMRQSRVRIAGVEVDDVWGAADPTSDKFRRSMMNPATRKHFEATLDSAAFETAASQVETLMGMLLKLPGAAANFSGPDAMQKLMEASTDGIEALTRRNQSRLYSMYGLQPATPKKDPVAPAATSAKAQAPVDPAEIQAVLKEMGLTEGDANRKVTVVKGTSEQVGAKRADKPVTPAESEKPGEDPLPEEKEPTGMGGAMDRSKLYDQKERKQKKEREGG